MDDETLGQETSTASKWSNESRHMFTEISLLMSGEVPKGAIVNTTAPQSTSQYWGEVARYVLYEEVFEEESKQFSIPQYPSLSYRYFDKLCSVLNKDLQMIRSTATTTENLVKDIVTFLEAEGDVTTAEDLKDVEGVLSAPRWHPQVNPRQNFYRLPRLSVSGPGRRLSLVTRAEDAADYVNKYLSVCLPPNSEACSVMIGHLPYFTRPLYLLIRLTTEPAPKLSGLVEVDAGVRFVFLAITPKFRGEKDVYQIGRCFAAMLNEGKFLTLIYRAHKPADVYKAALSFRRDMIVIASGCPDILNRSGGIDVPPTYYNEVHFEGTDLIFEDHADDMSKDDFMESNLSLQGDTRPDCSCKQFKRFCPPFHELFSGIRILFSRIPSDYIDAFTKDNVGTMLSSILFIYFVVFAPSITFGTLMLNEVNPSYNISLNIFATGIFTLLYTLFAGQPMASIGPSGPGFILETVVASFAGKIGADYQVYRFWVGVYIALFGIILIGLNLSSLFSYARRSLEEIFSAFISIFLILKATFTMFRAVPRNLYEPKDPGDVQQLNEAFLSFRLASRAAIHLFLAFCMLIFSVLINKLKRSHFFRRTFRYWTGAFNVPLGIVFVSLLNYIFFSTYPVTKLDVPRALNANPKSWITLVDFSKVLTFTQPSPGVMHGMAIAIGFFFALLIFTESALNSVTALKPKAKKPSPFVIDHLLMVVVFPLISCILGWPFMSGVPVRTIANTMALVKVDPHPPPGKPAEIISLVEQRVSLLLVGVLVTVSVYFGDVLRLIPVAALYGMFIYLGLVGLRGLDSVNTLMALLTRRKYWGRWEFLTNLPTPQLAVITSINFGELAILIIFIVVAEFAHAGYMTLATPLVLIGSGLVREYILPAWNWLAPTLAKYDKRCLPTHSQGAEKENKSETSYPEKSDRVSSVETLIF